MAVSTVYCTQADVEAILSAEGLVDRTDDSEDLAGETALITLVIQWATDRVNLYVARRYTVADLATSTFINDVTAHFASCQFCKRRGNPCPESLNEQCKEFLEELKKIKDGDLTLPNSPERSNQLPALSNVRIDGRFQNAKVRVQKTISTGGESTLGQNTDVTELGLDLPK